ncbi:PD-(D/E)XK nuclease family protein [Nocardioidaceae bacterium]|nr:PD-(D/E)XK nuclease family protein [Nocardioidaceae bacterium]
MSSPYVVTYGDELAELEFEPEREFEVLLPEENVLITGAIDVVRRDSPPRISIVDLKSGEAVSDNHDALDEEEMRLQVSTDAIAAKQELEYEPESGLVRYLAEPDPDRRELTVPLSDDVIAESREQVAGLAGDIQRRDYCEALRRTAAKSERVAAPRATSGLCARCPTRTDRWSSVLLLQGRHQRRRRFFVRTH